MKLTSHTTAMHLVIQFSGDGVVPRERSGPGSQLFMGASPEQGAEQLVTHWQVVQDLQHLNQNRNRDREQHQRLQRIHHDEQDN